MIRAVIFDCFGVLTTDGWLAFKDTYLMGDDAKLAEASELNRQADAGLISQQDFEQQITTLADITLGETKRLIDDSHVRNDQLFGYIRDQLKPSYKIGLLSNAAGNYLGELFEPWQVELFDATAFSYEVGTVKPDTRMYETIAVRLGCLPEECVFIDDREVFVTGGREAGMPALQFINNQQAQRDIAEILGQSSAGAA